MFVDIPSRRAPNPRLATPLLVAAAMASFVWLASLGDTAVRDVALLRWGTLSSAGLVPGREWEIFSDGRFLSLFTALFIHVDWLHLLGNMLFLMIFGLPAERALGAWRFAALFLFGGALANLGAAELLSGSPEQVVIVGASGAVSALIGAYLTLFPGARLGFVLPLGFYLEFVRAPASVMIGIWALLQGLFAYIGPAFGAVAWSAHLIGFAVGALMALLFRPAVARRLRGR